MNDIRKVLGELLEIVRCATWTDSTVDLIQRAESLLASLPADGGAWYPSSMDVSRRADAAYANRDNIIRAAIDLYRSRGGQAGGEVVRQYQHVADGPDSEWYPYRETMELSWSAMAAMKDIFQTRELVAHQPAAQAVVKESLTTSVTVPADVIAATERVRGLLSSLMHGQRIPIDRDDAGLIVTFLQGIVRP